MLRLAVVSIFTFVLQACAPAFVPEPPPPLHQKLAQGDIEGARAELQAGADPNVASPNGDYALHAAASAMPMQFGAQDGSTRTTNPDNAAMIEMLLEHGANPGVKHNTLGYTPLHVAADAGAVNTLIAAGLDVGARDVSGNTPLHYGLAPDATSALLEHGADPTVANNAGKTPVQVLVESRKNVRKMQMVAGNNTDLERWKKKRIDKINEIIAVLNGGEVPQGAIPETAPKSLAKNTENASGDRLSHLVIDGNDGEYMCPWTSDGVLAEWVDKAINAKMGSAAGSAVGAYAGQKAMEQIPFIGGFLGSKVGDAAGRKIALEAAGGEEHIRSTSDMSFESLNAMARYIKANYSDDRHFQDAVEAANEIYPGLSQAMASTR